MTSVEEPADALPAQAVPRWLRRCEAVAGVLSAGVVVLGLGLLVAQLVAPRLGGTGLEAATGPGWDRVVATIAAGVAAEMLRAVRRTASTGWRAGAVCAVLTGIALLLWFTWWR